MSARLNRASAREIITVPPHGEPQLVCPLWPECECQANCIAGGQRRRVMWIVYGLAIATGLIGGVMLMASLNRFNWIFCLAMTASVSFDAWLVHLVLR
ncbi:MAG: hypothetical protein EOQ52_20630 [Mesorhizobium sp.]|uniref:hypothetical protein n=1 Tax=Mesorhizobium sp. TaxID=1871066 RepID=UPI000FE6D65E|nr:hypothetical protein [Mesorhizobium sp.]RWB85956.1 MAG: hypothetical protein EOQ52_20630 [Mesorhizobium sp.]